MEGRGPVVGWWSSWRIGLRVAMVWTWRHGGAVLVQLVREEDLDSMGVQPGLEVRL